MLFCDSHGKGTSFAKDPCVVSYHGKVFLYYSAKSLSEIGIATSSDLEHWLVEGYISPEQEAEGKGICAPAAIVLGDTLHLFYQSYGQFPKDYICHATSTDGYRFTRDATNPIIKPHGAWNVGRAIDADVVAFNGELFCYWATRDPEAMLQMLGVSSAPLYGGLHRDSWTQRCKAPILKPVLPWEQECIEAPAAMTHDGKVYLFYGGAYNCCPQQIGCAVSTDGIRFRRISKTPLMGPGQPGSWNASESGHPYAWTDDAGRDWLFYQGSPDDGETWMLSKARILFENNMPQLVPDLM